MTIPDEPADKTLVLPPSTREVPGQQAGAAGIAATDAQAVLEVSLPLGTRLGEFEVRQVLGVGGFGIVYEVWDHSLECEAAVKELMPTDLVYRQGSTVCLKSDRHKETFEAGLRSFVNEARSLANLARSHHPALVRVNRFWVENGTAYMAMPLYRGPTLKAWVSQNTQPPSEAWLLALLDPLTEALDLVHQSGLAHRDISPDNIILLEGSGQPLLLDFGAARRVIGDLTQTLTAILKPSYAPVEQYGDMPNLQQGPWTDVYSLCATLYYVLRRTPPPPSVGRAVNDSYVPLAKQLEGHYSLRLLSAIDHGLSFKPADRFQSMEDFRAALGIEARLRAMPRAVANPGAEPPSPAASRPAEVGVLGPGAPRHSDAAPAPVVATPGGSTSDAADPTQLVGPLRVGQLVAGRYQVEQTLRAGSGLERYAAVDVRSKSSVLLAVVAPKWVPSAVFVERLVQESALWQRLGQPEGLLPLKDVVNIGSSLAYVFSKPAGPTLRDELLARKREQQHFSLPEVLAFLKGLVPALEALHGHGAHLALTPDALWSDGQGHYQMAGTGFEQAMGPLGVGRLAAAEGIQSQLAPEVAQGQQAQAGPRSDQFALAAMAFEMLTGLAYGRPHDLKRLKDPSLALPAAVFKALAKALSERPSKRFPSVQAFVQAMQSARSWGGGLWLLVLGGVALAVAVAWWAAPAWLNPMPSPAPQAQAWAQQLAQGEAQLQSARASVAKALGQAQQRLNALDAAAKATPALQLNPYGWVRERAQADVEVKTLAAGLVALDRLMGSEGPMGSVARLRAQAQESAGDASQAEALGREAIALQRSLLTQVSGWVDALALKVRAHEKRVQLQLLAADFPEAKRQAFEAAFKQASVAFEANDHAQARAIWGQSLASVEADLLRELPLIRERWATQMERMPDNEDYQELLLKARSVCTWMPAACTEGAPAAGSAPKQPG